MHKYKIELVTTADVFDFVKISSAEIGDVKLIDGTGFCVNGKSLLGAMAAVEWKTLYCITDNEFYTQIARFCIE